MATIKNEDLELMCKIEELLHKKLVQTNGIKDKDGDNYYFSEDDKEYALWVDYWNMVENLISAREKDRKKSRDFNANNKEYHNLNNNLYQARKRNNKKQIELYTKKIEEYKKAKELNKAKEVIINGL